MPETFIFSLLLTEKTCFTRVVLEASEPTGSFSAVFKKYKFNHIICLFAELLFHSAASRLWLLVFSTVVPSKPDGELGVK